MLQSAVVVFPADATCSAIVVAVAAVAAAVSAVITPLAVALFG